MAKQDNADDGIDYEEKIAADFNATEDDIEDAKEEAIETGEEVIIDSRTVHTPKIQESDLGEYTLYADSDGNIDTRTIGYY